MSLVQIQLRDRRGALLDVADLDLSTPDEYREAVRPFDRRAREIDGTAKTVSSDSPLFYRSLDLSHEDEQ